ncbi:MAG: phosphoglycerate mutase [Naasia sp.]|nr:phosphoglycerate mutase [Naasia sp.]
MGAVELLLVRHGESEANVAANTAERRKIDRIPVPARDPDVVLSPAGIEQARALGQHLTELPPEQRPDALWASPYRRTRQTAELTIEAAGFDLVPRFDERLRDRELGIIDALTGRGVARLYPEEAQRRRWVGKFYYRPPGGESWADVALRLRSVMGDVDRDEDGKRVLVVCHDAVIRLFRYVCERLDEETIVEIGRKTPVPNASITRLLRPSGEGPWTAEDVSDTEHLRDEGAPVTVQESSESTAHAEQR